MTEPCERQAPPGRQRRTRILAARSLVFLAGLACDSDGVAGTAVRAPIAFVDVTVVTLDQPAALQHQTVVVRDGHVAGVGGGTAVPPDAVVVDGSGKLTEARRLGG